MRVVYNTRIKLKQVIGRGWAKYRDYVSGEYEAIISRSLIGLFANVHVA